jgi:hypothetical protein
LFTELFENGCTSKPVIFGHVLCSGRFEARQWRRHLCELLYERGKNLVGSTLEGNDGAASAGFSWAALPFGQHWQILTRRG